LRGRCFEIVLEAPRGWDGCPEVVLALLVAQEEGVGLAEVVAKGLEEGSLPKRGGPRRELGMQRKQSLQHRAHVAVVNECFRFRFIFKYSRVRLVNTNV